MSDNQQEFKSNVPEFSVSELAFSLKKTLEDTYSRVRVRGELSRVSIPASGHMYSTLKDEKSAIDSVCWKGTLSKLAIKPEEGMEVICTGRISTYPARSNYQLIIETMELAGEGALLKLLEERKKKLAQEGLFDQDRKQPIPFLPDTIGVITSPTGAVIRDILHRLADRFPRNVLVWPVLVQGEKAAQQVTEAINGFNALENKPDLLIVARGGGSLEDLMPFNEESVVRAVANSTIPIISAVGHETDTTLIDYAADLRAPTPTGAAEMAVPMRAHLMAQIGENGNRLLNGMNRMMSERRHQLDASSARLGDPAKLLEIKTQSLDHLSDKLTNSYQRFLSVKQGRIIELGAQLRTPQNKIDEARRTLNNWDERLSALGTKLTQQKQKDLGNLSNMLEVLSFKNTLERGFVVVRDTDGAPITSANGAKAGTSINLQFKQDKYVKAIIGKKSANIAQKKQTSKSPKKPDKNQQNLF